MIVLPAGPVDSASEAGIVEDALSDHRFEQNQHFRQLPDQLTCVGFNERYRTRLATPPVPVDAVVPPIIPVDQSFVLQPQFAGRATYTSAFRR